MAKKNPKKRKVVFSLKGRFPDDPIVRRWRKFKDEPGLSLQAKILLVVAQEHPHNGSFTDDGIGAMTDRANAVERHLVEKGELTAEEIAESRQAEAEVDVEPFVGELRKGLLDHDDSAPTPIPTLLMGKELVNDLCARAWAIVAREFGHESLWNKLLYVHSLLSLGLLGHANLPQEVSDALREHIHQWSMDWLYKRRSELLSTAPQNFVAGL